MDRVAQPSAIRLSPLSKQSIDPLHLPTLPLPDGQPANSPTILSDITAPTQPPSPVNPPRPPVFRTSSAPGISHPDSEHPSRKLLPSALPPTPSRREADDGKPIFEILDSDLGTPAKEMVKVFKGHLDSVLKVQEEIGRMHLGLEKLSVAAPDGWAGSDGEADRGAKDKTPSSSPLQKAKEVLNGNLLNAKTPSPGTSPIAPGATRDATEPTTKEASNESLAKREKGVEEIMSKLGVLSEHLRTYHSLGTPMLSFPQPALPLPNIPEPARKETRARTPKEIPTSPPHIAVANLRGSAMPPTPRSPITPSSSRSPLAAREQRAEGEAGALSPLTRIEEPNKDSFWDSQQKERDESWIEGSSSQSPERLLRGHQAWVDSPLEIVDRSRPW